MADDDASARIPVVPVRIPIFLFAGPWVDQFDSTFIEIGYVARRELRIV
jgi:hypothetical protein